MHEDLQKVAAWLSAGSVNVFGVPFAGKDTQCEVLADLLHGVVVSSGDILRHDHGNTEIQRIMAAGGIVPSELFAQVVTPFLSRSELSGKPLILSEVGRAEGEQHIIMDAASESGHPLKTVVLLQLSDEEAFRRFDIAQVTQDRGKRADDKRSVLKTRLDAYRSVVAPVIDFYRESGLLVEVDGAPPRAAVTEKVVKALAAHAAKQV